MVWSKLSKSTTTMLSTTPPFHLHIYLFLSIHPNYAAEALVTGGGGVRGHHSAACVPHQPHQPGRGLEPAAGDSHFTNIAI